MRNHMPAGQVSNSNLSHRSSMAMLLCALFLLVTSASAQIVVNPENGHTYSYVKIRGEISWSDAQAAATAAGGYLMTVTDATEQAIVTGFMDDTGDEAWLGGTDKDSEGVWTWVTGEPWDYTNWYPGEPNAAFEDEDYLLTQVQVGGAWIDAGTPQTGYIIEWDDSSPYGFHQWREEDGGNGHWYGLMLTAQSWDEARNQAQSFRYNGKFGHLATVTSEAENDFIVNNVITEETEVADVNFSCARYWLGGIAFGNFEWITGEPFEYTNWAEGYPVDVDTVEAIAMAGPLCSSPPYVGQWISRSPACDIGYDDCLPALVEIDTDPAHICRVLHVPGQYPTIMAAIEAADDCDRVLVGPGVYHESINFMGKNIEVKSTDGPLHTIITNERRVDLVTFENGETRAAVLDGFTLKGGWMAVVIAGSAPTISHNICVNQNVWNWAAIGIIGELVRLTDPTGDPRYTGSIGPAGAALINNTIIYSANGGVSSFSSDPILIRNNIIAFNAHYGLHHQNPNPDIQPQPDIAYNDIYGHGDFTYGPYGDMINIIDPGPGHLSVDPMLTSDYTLSEGSPCIDTGDPSIAYLDPDGSRNDMGAVPFHHGTGGEVIPTNEWIVVYCSGIPDVGEDPAYVELIEAFDPDGVLCGRGLREAVVGRYQYMPIYRDDPETDIDEGAEPGDLISFRIDGEPVMPLEPVYWTANGDMTEVCYFEEQTCIDIPIYHGWNLVSWNVAYEGDVAEAFESIASVIDVVLTYDGGGLVYDPDLPQYSTLQTVDYHHAYWIRAFEDATLHICGGPIPPDEKIDILAGWNLAAYWPDTPMTPGDALVSLSYEDLTIVQQVMGFDQGALIWTPEGGYLSTLETMNPGFGYWIKSSMDASLYYPPFGGIDPDDFELGGRVAQSTNTTSLEASREWMAVYGSNITVDGTPLADGARIEFVSGETVCGVGEYHNGLLRMAPVYGYDSEGDLAKAYPKLGDAIAVYVDGARVFPELSWQGNGSRAEVRYLTADSRGLPRTYLLDQNYPNPFNPDTKIAFEVPVTGRVKIDVINTLGQRVKTLTDREYVVGRHSVEWDGTDESGSKVASGVYFYRLTTDRASLSKKMVLLK